MFDSHRKVFTTVHGAIWLVAITKSACKFNIRFMVPFMGGGGLSYSSWTIALTYLLYIYVYRNEDLILPVVLLLSRVFLHQVLVAQLFLQPHFAANKQHGFSTSVINMVTEAWLTQGR
jgi:hypothetical protein